MKKIVVIGAGVSGLSIARLLVDGGNKVTVIEKEDKPGGLIKCDNINGCLYHKVGGHVFNTKRKDVLEQLQMQGRKIGVISHVQEMSERISVQVQVHKKVNGKSVLTVVG